MIIGEQVSCALSQSRISSEYWLVFDECEAYPKAIHTQDGNAQPPITLVGVIVKNDDYSEYH